MSLDLFEETDNVLANLRPVAEPEPGVWDNFTAGAGKVAMQTFAKAGRAASMAAAPLAMAFEKAPGSTEVQDKFFKAHDDIFGRAVDYWTPKPGEVGEAGMVVGSLLGTLPMVFASPAAAVASTQLSAGEDLVRKGVDAGTAQAVGASQAVGLGLGIWVPILGKTLAQRVLLGGAGFNVVQGTAMRAAGEALLEGTPGEKDYQAFDPTQLTLDVLLGAAFGGLAHVHPRMRAEGEAWHKRVAEWGAKLKPSEVDALAALRQSQHLNADSMPGKPVDVADTNAHVDRMRQAIDDLANDRPVDVEDMPAPRFEAEEARAEEARAEEANAAIRAMQDEARAEGVVLEENVLPKVSPQETAPSIDDATGLPLNADGTVTLYHHTSAKKAAQIRKTGELKADAEPDVYVTTRQETDTGYGDTAVQIRVKPDSLSLDDEFPDGRKDFRLNVGKPGGSVKVSIQDDAPAPAARVPKVSPPEMAPDIADPIYRASIEAMANETGWAEVGGRMIRNEDGSISRTAWVPNAEWWPGRPKELSEAKAKKAIQKALDGEPLKPAEQRLIDYMLEYARERVAPAMRRLEAMDEAERARMANDLLAEGLEGHVRDLADYDLVRQASEIDEAALERAAIMYQNDDAAFIREAERIVGEHTSRQPYQGAAPDGGGEARQTAAGATRPDADAQAAGLDPLATEAARFASENPDMPMFVGKNADGSDITTTPRQWLEDADAALRQANDDVKLFEIAAGCLLGGGR